MAKYLIIDYGLYYLVDEIGIKELELAEAKEIDIFDIEKQKMLKIREEENCWERPDNWGKIKLNMWALTL